MTWLYGCAKAALSFLDVDEPSTAVGDTVFLFLGWSRVHVVTGMRLSKVISAESATWSGSEECWIFENGAEYVIQLSAVVGPATGAEAADELHAGPDSCALQSVAQFKTTCRCSCDTHRGVFDRFYGCRNEGVVGLASKHDACHPPFNRFRGIVSRTPGASQTTTWSELR